MRSRDRLPRHHCDSATLPNGAVGTAYNATVTASGGVGPYTFAVTSGALPTGLVLSGAGAITGTPTTAGTFNFTNTATDTSSGCLGSRAYSIVIGVVAPAGASTLDFVGLTILMVLLAGAGLFDINRFPI